MYVPASAFVSPRPLLYPVLTCNSPQRLCPRGIKAQDRTISTSNDKRLTHGGKLADKQRVHPVLHLSEKDVRVALHVVRQEIALRADKEQIGSCRGGGGGGGGGGRR